jgi:hypothetical protein
MKLSQEFTVLATSYPRPHNLKPHFEFPMLGNTPVVAIDLDDTLSEYDGWKGPTHFGAPRENAIWALKCFKHNGWEVEIFTSRNHDENVKRLWVDKYAPGLIDRVNETRHHPDTHEDPGRDSPKPKVDLFIDDRSDYWYGRELDWIEIMERLDKKGLFPKGLLPR